jgi:hypothetical protein
MTAWVGLAIALSPIVIAMTWVAIGFWMDLRKSRNRRLYSAPLGNLDAHLLSLRDWIHTDNNQDPSYGWEIAKAVAWDMDDLTSLFLTRRRPRLSGDLHKFLHESRAFAARVRRKLS